MSRTILAGSTDYSHQTFDDIIVDLREWVVNLDATTEALSTREQHFESNGYWPKVDFHIQAIIGYAMKFFTTSRTEITEIIGSIQMEVEKNHVVRIRSLAHTAKALHIDIGKAWHSESWDADGKYGEPNFLLVEQMYKEARSMAADMVDMDNLATRLGDFVGMKKRASIPPNSGGMLETENIHPNILTLIHRTNDSLIRGDYSGVLHSSASIFETLAKDIVGIPGVQDQTLKSFFSRYRKDSSLPVEVLDFILAIYESRNTTPIAGHGSTNIPNISREEAIVLTEMTLAFVKIEYKLRK